MSRASKAEEEEECFDRLGLHGTNDTCKAFAAVVCVGFVALSCVSLVVALKPHHDTPAYRMEPYGFTRPPSLFSGKASRDDDDSTSGPGATAPEDDEDAGRRPGRIFRRGGKFRGRGGKFRGRGGKGKGRGGAHFNPFADLPEFGVRGKTGDYLWSRGAGRRGHHIDSGIGPMRVTADVYDAQEAHEKAARCLRDLDGTAPPKPSTVLGEKGFVPSPAKWLESHEDNVEAAQSARNRNPQPKQLFLGDSIVRRLGVGVAGAGGGNGIASSELLALGISGDTTANLLWRIRHGELPRGLAPEKIVLLIGTNDLAHGRAASPYTPLRATLATCAVIRHVRSQGLRAPISLTLVLPRGKAWPHGREANATAQTNELLRAMVSGAARAANVRVVDCGSRFVIPDGRIKSSLMPDYTHPSPKGYLEWKACLADSDAIAEAALQKAVAAGDAPAELARRAQQAPRLGKRAGVVRMPAVASPGAEKLKRIAATSLHLKRPKAAAATSDHA